MRRRPPGSGCGCALVLLGFLAALPFVAWAADGFRAVWHW